MRQRREMVGQSYRKTILFWAYSPLSIYERKGMGIAYRPRVAFSSFVSLSQQVEGDEEGVEGVSGGEGKRGRGVLLFQIMKNYAKSM